MKLKYETIKLLEENRGRMLLDLEFGEGQLFIYFARIYLFLYLIVFS